MKEKPNKITRWPIVLLCTVAILLAVTVQQGFTRLRAQTELSAGTQKGFGYASFNVGEFSSPESDADLEKMADIGANAISIVGSIYQTDVDSTEVFTYHYFPTPGETTPPPFPSTPTDEDFEQAIAKAHDLGMSVKLKIHLDLQQPSTPGDWRGDIGPAFSEADWTAWFASYTEKIVHYAELAEANDVEIFSIGAELVGTVRRPEWSDVIVAVRNVYSGEITYAANHGNERNVIFWPEVDYIGVDAYYNLTNKVNPNVPELLAAWAGPLASMDALNDANNLPILLTEIGYLNADGTNQHPWCYTAVQNCTTLPEAPDPQEQATLFEALFQMMESRDFIQGVYIWDFRSEPDSTCDISYSPYNKPAENVIRSWFGATMRQEIEDTCATGPIPLEPDDPNAPPTPTPQSATINPVESVIFEEPQPDTPIEFKGMGYAQYKPDIYESLPSDETIEAIADTGAEWVSILATWYQEDSTSTQIAPDSQKTPTDVSIVHVISKAHSVGLNVLLKPHVDLQNTQSGTSWRGEIGWDADKTPIWPDGGTEWNSWFESYKTFINHYATIAEENGVEMYSVGTELESATLPQRTAKWDEVIAGVRNIYSGPLTYAANHSGEEACIEFWRSLDFMGIDAYYNLTSSKNPSVFDMQITWSGLSFRCDVDKIAGPTGPNLNLETLSDLNAGDPSDPLGDGEFMPVIFTEVGYRSLDGANQEPWNSGKQGAVDVGEQVDAYEALLKEFSKKTWWKGVFWWAYDIEAADSGTCDDSYSPHDKPVENLIRAWYGAEQRPEIEPVCPNPPAPTPVPTATSIVIPPPAGSGLGYADITIYDIASVKFVTQVFTTNYAAGQPVDVDGTLISEGRVPDATQGENGLEEKKVRDYRATKICGYILPPKTGTYQFAVAGDDASWFQLSTDSSIENIVKIASHPFYTDRFEWTKYANEQISNSMQLQAGHPYRFELLHVNRTGGDRTEVGWKGPGFNMQLVGSDYLWPCSEPAPTPVPTSVGNVDPTPLPTNTPVPPTNTPVPLDPTATSAPGEPTNTPPPTNTSVPVATATKVPATATAMPTATPVSASNPSVTWGASGSSGSPGSQFSLSGVNFDANEEIVLKIDALSAGEPTGASVSSTVTANASGSFEIAVDSAGETAPGTYSFTIVGYPDLKIESLVIGTGMPMRPSVTATQRVELPPTGTSQSDGFYYLPFVTN